MEKRGWIQNKYLIKAYLKEKSYESSNRIDFLILFSLLLIENSFFGIGIYKFENKK